MKTCKHHENTQGQLEKFCCRRRRIFYPKTDIAGEDGRLDSSWVPTEEQPSLDAPTVARICATHFGRLPLSVHRLSGKGTFHFLYRTELSPGEGYIIRTGIPGDAWPAFEFYIDAWITGVMASRGLPVAPVHRADLSRQLCPFDYEIMSEARGKQLTTFEDKVSQYVDPHLLSELGRCLAQIHEIETAHFGLLDIRTILAGANRKAQGLLPSWEDYLFLNLAEHIGCCLDMGVISSQESKRIEKAFEISRDILAGARSHLLHGDLGHHNVFTDGRRITAIIDWEDCLCGDPVFDLAYWGTFCRDRLREPFLRGYRRRRRLPDDFEERYWLYYLRIALSKTVHRHRFRHRDRPGRPPASLRIQKGLQRFEGL
jgi:aminoglycoside phosphotransferase (APT) family kinase protein